MNNLTVLLPVLQGLLLLLPCTVKSQEIQFNDLLGNWKVNKCELYSSGEFVKSASLDNSAGDAKVIEGRYAGKLEEEINSNLKSIVGSVLNINEDSTVSWETSNDKLDFNNAFWQLNSTGELMVCRYENKLTMSPLLFTCRIQSLTSEGLRIIFFEGGLEVRVLLVRS